MPVCLHLFNVMASNTASWNQSILTLAQEEIEISLKELGDILIKNNYTTPHIVCISCYYGKQYHTIPYHAGGDMARHSSTNCADSDLPTR